MSFNSVQTEFVQCIDHIKSLTLKEFDRQIQTQQLYYHTRDHIAQVQRRSHIIFEAIRSDLPPESSERMELLLELCAIAHDMIQVFDAQIQDHTTRKRSTGVSETATIETLIQYIHSSCPNVFTESDQAMIHAAISATICQFDSQQQTIYQPLLEQSDLPIIARILALADLGALGIDGIEMYNREGSLLFLEENPDFVPLLVSGEIAQLARTNSDLAENIQQRLLKRCRFQVNFAKSRLARFKQEIQGLSIEKLQPVFKHLNESTIQLVEATTPIRDRTSLVELLEFFKFEQYLRRLQ